MHLSGVCHEAEVHGGRQSAGGGVRVAIYEAGVLYFKQQGIKQGLCIYTGGENFLLYR